MNLKLFTKDPLSVGHIPKLLEIEPTKGCNLRCIMCHVSYEKGKPQYMNLDTLRKSTLGVTDCHVIIGSEYEPTIHPQFDKLLRLSIDRNWKIDFLTNGVNLHKIDPKVLADVNFNVFNVSFDGATDKTFSKIRIGANYTKEVIDNIAKASEIVRKHGAYTAVNSTLMNSNLEEAETIVQLWNTLHFDLIRFLIMQVRDPGVNALTESLYTKTGDLASALNGVSAMLSKNQFRIGVRNGYYASAQYCPPENINCKSSTIFTNNPDFRHVPSVRQDIQLGDWPGMKWSCKSPFVYCRVRWDGNVDICNNRNLVIGNIERNSISDIWSSWKAYRTRRTIISTIGICKKCDYYRFCISQHSLDKLKRKLISPTGYLAILI